MQWYFPPNNDADIIGINNSGVETFQGTPLKSLAREICQNSIDASISDEPVSIEFMPFELPSNELIGIDSLLDAFEKSTEYWSEQSTRDSVEFFERGTKVMKGETIPFLRVSDFNTKGLQGSDKDFNTPWVNLTKSHGVSDKSGTSGGSFGIGKFAPFACSALRTIFYSTVDEDGLIASQGISRIASFRQPEEGLVTMGVGYFGNDRNRPLATETNLDPNFCRGEGQTGTDIFISGFLYFNMDWKSDIIASVLDGFLCAIYNEKLIVRVGDTLIDKDNLQGLLLHYKDAISENAGNYFRVLTSPDAVWFEENYRNQGEIKLGLIIQPEMHRKVAMIRKTGMKIMDRGNISGVIPFAGVLIIEGDEINDFLRGLENPQHTKWEPKRVEPKEREPYAREYIKGLVDFIKASLDTLKEQDLQEEVDPDIGEYLPLIDENESTTEPKLEEALPAQIQSIDISMPTQRPRNSGFAGNDAGAVSDDEGSEPAVEDSEGAGHDEGETSEGDHRRRGEDEGSGEGLHPAEKRKTPVGVSADKVRTICLNRETGEYSLTFVPLISATNGYFDLYLSAESQKYKAPIQAASQLGGQSLEVVDNRISGLVFRANEPIRIKFMIDYEDYCSMEVEAYGNQI